LISTPKNKKSFGNKNNGTTPVFSFLTGRMKIALNPQIRSSAFTKEVVKNGRIRVTHSQWVYIAKPRPAAVIKKRSHQIALDFFSFSMN